MRLVARVLDTCMSLKTTRPQYEPALAVTGVLYQKLAAADGPAKVTSSTESAPVLVAMPRGTADWMNPAPFGVLSHFESHAYMAAWSAWTGAVPGSTVPLPLGVPALLLQVATAVDDQLVSLECSTHVCPPQ